MASEAPKEVKPEENSDEEGKSISAILIERKGQKKSTVKVEKCEIFDDEHDNNQNPRKKRPVKKEVEVTVKVTEHTKKRANKTYDLPGQKRDAPDEKDPLRIFYGSLLKQVPTSEMAALWMMEMGLLPKEEAEKVYAKKQSKKTIQQPSPKKKKTVTVKEKKAAGRSAVRVKKKTVVRPVSKAKMDKSGKPGKNKKTKRKISNSEGSSDEVVISRKKARR